MQIFNSTFKTTSLNLSAYLIVQGFKLIGKTKDPENYKKVIFLFQNNQKIETAANNYLTGRGGKVDVDILFAAQKKLKNLLYEDSFHPETYAPYG